MCPPLNSSSKGSLQGQSGVEMGDYERILDLVYISLWEMKICIATVTLYSFRVLFTVTTCTSMILIRIESNSGTTSPIFDFSVLNPLLYPQHIYM